VPARPLDTINAHHILLALRSGSGRELPMAEAPALAEIYGEFARIEDAERSASEKISLLALASRAEQPAITAPPTGNVEKQITHITDALVVEEISKTARAETGSPKASEEPEPEASNPPAKPAADISPEKKSRPRDIVRPEERDFPL